MNLRSNTRIYPPWISNPPLSTCTQKVSSHKYFFTFKATERTTKVGVTLKRSFNAEAVVY